MFITLRFFALLVASWALLKLHDRSRQIAIVLLDIALRAIAALGRVDSAHTAAHDASSMCAGLNLVYCSGVKDPLRLTLLIEHDVSPNVAR